MPPAALVVGAGLAVTAGSAIMQGIAANNAGKAQSGLFKRQAGLDLEESGNAIAQSDYRTAATISADTAAAGAAGVSPGTGSAKIVKQMNASYGQLNDTMLRYSGQLSSQADLARASFARFEGRQKLYGAIGSAVGGTLLTAGLPKAQGGLGMLGP
jgi:hypothetical protein